MSHPKAHSVVSIDFETYSAAPLPTVGLANYVADPTFRPTLAAVATDTGIKILDFVTDPDAAEKLQDLICEPGLIVVAHNAGFEEAVLDHLGITVDTLRDSAVVAAVAGANRHLAGAARQLLDVPKLDEDGRLLRLFAMPAKDQDPLDFDETLVTRFPAEWQEFQEYCMRDAELARRIYLEWHGDLTVHLRESQYADVTARMNKVGWPVDVPTVRNMYDRFTLNLDRLQEQFAIDVDDDLNMASHVQVSAWCAERGVKSTSFDKQHVAKLINRLEKKQAAGGLTVGEEEVLRMLLTKQELGGSSLKKLETILDTQHEGRLYDQYVHAGAAQSLRTSGRSVQMQNLPRLAHLRDVSELEDPDSVWTNEDLSHNLRQVFRASHPDGELVVADYASIESRALAWLAEEQWKLDAYAAGEDIYKVQATKIFGLTDVSLVTAEQRQTGKVGELSCGYGAGDVAVKDFAEKMGVLITEAEARRLVYDWRSANPRIVEFWSRLHKVLTTVVSTDTKQWMSAGQGELVLRPTTTPQSLVDQSTNEGFEGRSIEMVLQNRGGVVLRRVFHGCHMVGTNVGYYKPSSLKTGEPWKRTYVDPKTGRQRRYELYGGKLAGILTQSLCREIFFSDLLRLSRLLDRHPNATLVGQFHDEVIVEWEPGELPLLSLLFLMRETMTSTNLINGLPMAVSVKHAPQYVK